MVVTLSQSSCVSPVELTDRRGGMEWARSRIIRPQESLALHNRSMLSGFDVCKGDVRRYWLVMKAVLCIRDDFS
jgi:hypothetical protein